MSDRRCDLGQRSCAFRLRAAERFDGPAQIGRAAAGVLPSRKFLKHAAQHVDAAEDGIDAGRCHRQSMRAKLVQKIFEIVSPRYQVIRVPKTGATLDGVKGAEDRGECFLVAGICFQTEDVFLGPLQQFLRLDQVILQNV